MLFKFICSSLFKYLLLYYLVTIVYNVVRIVYFIAKQKLMLTNIFYFSIFQKFWFTYMFLIKKLKNRQNFNRFDLRLTRNFSYFLCKNNFVLTSSTVRSDAIIIKWLFRYTNQQLSFLQTLIFYIFFKNQKLIIYTEDFNVNAAVLNNLIFNVVFLEKYKWFFKALILKKLSLNWCFFFKHFLITTNVTCLICLADLTKIKHIFYFFKFFKKPIFTLTTSIRNWQTQLFKLYTPYINSHVIYFYFFFFF